MSALWDRTTAPQSRGVLLLVLDLSKRAWSGSKRAKLFYKEQQRLWIDLLMRFLPDRATVEELLRRSRELSWRSWSQEIVSRGGGR